MIRLILFSFVVLMQTVKAADDELMVKLNHYAENTVVPSIKMEYLQVPAHNLTMAKNALPFRIARVMRQEDLSTVSEQELQCIKDYLKSEKSKEYQEWLRKNDCNINCGLFSAIVTPPCLAVLGTYLCAEFIGLERTENTLSGAAIAAMPIGGYLACKFAQYYRPDQSEISNKIERTSQALRNKQKQD